MEIKFKDEKLRELCEKEKVARRKLGDACARKLHNRLADLVAGHPHPLKRDRSGQFALDLAGGVRLVFAPANDPTPKKKDASIDWSKVNAVRIEFIGDYHD